ncbi:MAG: enhanced intracellular survival protein Eis [Elainellaceae cyanobacterium]
MTDYDYRLASTQDLEFIKRSEQQGFLSTAADADRYVEWVGLKSFRILRHASQPVGGLVILPSAQWWFGQKIVMAGIASVSVLPESRRQGHARELIQAALNELYDAKTPLSALYSAADPLYRRMGYGTGGTFCHWQVPLHQIGIADVPLSIQPVPLCVESLRPIQQEYARHHSGHLDRHQSIWTVIVDSRSKDKPAHFAYGVGPVNSPTGYVVFRLERGTPSTLTVLDWAMTTAEAGRSLWGFVSRYGSQVDVVRWRGGALDPMALLLPDQTAKLKSLERWMLRLVNVPLALEARGYPASVTAELRFRVIDAVLPANHGNWMLSVSNGRGTVTPDGEPQLTLTVDALASLYAGLLSPAQMRQAGLLNGTEAAMAIAASLFAGPSPWLPDFF